MAPHYCQYIHKRAGTYTDDGQDGAAADQKLCRRCPWKSRCCVRRPEWLVLQRALLCDNQTFCDSTTSWITR
uniref:Uncharacterized protein n=1 Tax=Macrostomum lignano TaxID=282301 RepID=A0A1I8FHV5_9PLAT